MKYKKVFDPDSRASASMPLQRSDVGSGDRFHGGRYVYTPEIVLAVNIGLVTKRPILVRGSSGSGKSSLASAVAEHFGWRYHATVITSRTQAQDLLWTFDTLRRLSDAQSALLSQRSDVVSTVDNGMSSMAKYIEPGVLWWAFDRDTARRRGLESAKFEVSSLAQEPGTQPDVANAVVLIDEIDKADPDTPNNLLVPLGSFEFFVQETGLAVVAKPPPLIFITTNGERELPPAFIRRCIVLDLPDPDVERLTAIAAAHFGTQKADVKLHRQIAEQIVDFNKVVAGKPPSVASSAEYLDAIIACRELSVSADAADQGWQAIRNAVVAKPAPASSRRV